LLGKKLGFLGVLGASLMAVSLSCGGGGGSPLTVDGFCSQYAANECSRTAGLCGVVVTSCEAARKTLCLSMVAGWAHSPRYFHPNKASTCLAKLKSIYNKDTILPSDFAGVDDACQRVFSGDVQKDQDCASKSDYECADTLICNPRTPMVCEMKVVKNANELCNNPGSVCQAGSFCTPTAAGSDVYKCLPKRGVNETCDVTDPINPASPCKEDLRCVAGKCVARLASGGACTSDDDCQATAPFCDRNLATPVCLTGLRFSPQGADCNAYGQSLSTGTGGTTGTGGGGGAAATGGVSGSAGAGGTNNNGGAGGTAAAGGSAGSGT